jgi:hypothetical protein
MNNINDIVAPEAKQQLIDINELLQELITTLKAVDAANKGIDVKVGETSGIKNLMSLLNEGSNANQVLANQKKTVSELTVAVGEYARITNSTAILNGKLAASASEEAKANAAAKVALQEVNKELIANAKLENESIQSKQKAVQASREFAASEKQRLANEKESVRSHKQMVRDQRDNELTTRMLQRAVDDLNKKREKAEALAIKEANAYEILKKEYNEAAYSTKTLAAEYVLLQRSGNASEEQLKRLRTELVLQQKATLAQSNALLQMEQAVGQSQRAVGNYANATAEISQILRELPNFAISAQTGILSLSNNVPMLQAALTRLSQTIDANTGKAIGWRGVLGTVASSIFSVQGGIILATTLLVAFGDKILNAIDLTSAAEKAQKSYNDALRETNKEVSGEIGELLRLQATLQSTSASRNQVLTAIDTLQGKYPGYFNNLNEENRMLSSVNKSIEYQIGLLTRQAEKKAASNAIGLATEELVKAQTDLNDKIGFFEKFLASAPFRSFKAYDEMTASAKALVDEQNKLYQAGLISIDEYRVMWRRISDVSDATDVVAEATKRSIDADYDKVEAIQKEIKEQERMIAHYKDIIAKWGPQMSGNARQEIIDREGIIAMLKLQAKGYEEARKEREKLDVLTPPEQPFIEIAKQEAETRAKLAKDNSKQELKEKERAAGYSYAIAIGAIKKEYAEKYNLRGQDLENNAQYQREVLAAYAEFSDELEKLQNKNDKANKPKRESVFDSTNELLSASQRIFAANQELERQKLEETNSYLANIFNLESESINKRLDAYEQYVENLKALEENEFVTATNEKKNKLAAIEEIEKRIGFVVTEENQRQVAALKNTTNEEKKLLLEKLAVNAELLAAQAAHASSLEQISLDAQQKERAIIKSNTTFLVNDLTNRYELMKAEVSKETAFRLVELEKQRQNGEISERQFWRMRQNVMSSESQILFNKEYEFLNNEYKRLIEDPTVPQAIKDTLTKLMGDLEKIRPESRRPDQRSIWQILGLTSQNSEDYEKAKGNTQEAIAKFGKDSAEAQAAIREEAAALQRVTADAEREIQSQLQGLFSTLFQSIDQSRENYFSKRFADLDKEKEKIEENLKAEKLAVTASVQSKEEKEKQFNELDKKAAAQQAALDQRRRALQRQQAVREKQDAIFKASLDAGVAITKAFATYPWPYNAIVAAIVGAQTAATIASISSRPIPAYWEGTGDTPHPGGPAIVGEVGSEKVILPSGQSFMTPGVPTLMDLPAGAQVISTKQLAEEAQAAAARDLVRTQARITEQNYSAMFIQKFEEGMDRSAKMLKNAVENIPQPIFHWDNGQLQKSFIKGGWRVNYKGNKV